MLEVSAEVLSATRVLEYPYTPASGQSSAASSPACESVEVPADQLIGQEDNGTFAMFNSLNPERILAAAICASISEAALRKAVPYAKERRVFKITPMGAYQAISNPLAEVKILLEAP